MLRECRVAFCINLVGCPFWFQRFPFAFFVSFIILCCCVCVRTNGTEALLYRMYQNRKSCHRFSPFAIHPRSPPLSQKKKKDENAVFRHWKDGLRNRNGELRILRLINERRRLSNKDQVEHLVRVSCRLIIFAIYVIDCPRIRGDLGANKDSLIRLKMCRRDPVDRETSET